MTYPQNYLDFASYLRLLSESPQDVLPTHELWVECAEHALKTAASHIKALIQHEKDFPTVPIEDHENTCAGFRAEVARLGKERDDAFSQLEKERDRAKDAEMRLGRVSDELARVRELYEKVRYADIQLEGYRSQLRLMQCKQRDAYHDLARAGRFVLECGAISQEDADEVRRWLAKDSRHPKTEAIKYIRRVSSLGLAQAKGVVEAIIAYDEVFGSKL